ncbi:MAG: hypothetical protein K5695_02300 [Oscillospiraceae bacterium]|nr:hypothetical protein [Oscillospiraceae bacterium]
MSGQATFDIVEVITQASQLPLVKVDREDFLRREFANAKYSARIPSILKSGPIQAGISKADIRKHAEGVIAFETSKATGISAAAGIPGGLAMIGTIPADMVNFYGHVLRVIQKLMYLYGWEDISNMDEGTKNIFILFLGAMSGVQVAEKAIGEICKSAAAKASKTLAAKALTKTVLYPIVKKVCTTLGIKMTKDIFAKGAAKVIPGIGAVISGGLTLATFLPMSRKLMRVLEENS